MYVYGVVIIKVPRVFQVQDLLLVHSGVLLSRISAVCPSGTSGLRTDTLVNVTDGVDTP